MHGSRFAWALVFALACSDDTPSGAGSPVVSGGGASGSTGAQPDAAAPEPEPGSGAAGASGIDEQGPRPEQLDPGDVPAGSAADAGLGAENDEPGADAGGPACPARGNVRYTLATSMAPTADEADAYARITAAMDRALEFYNCYTDLDLALRVSYEPGVATADGNVNGSMRFGSRASMNAITAMHEIGHTAGVGGPRFQPLIENGVYTGENATATLRELTGDPAAEIHGDTQHFWPYGLNYTSEVSSDEDLIRHCLIVGAMQLDF